MTANFMGVYWQYCISHIEINDILDKFFFLHKTPVDVIRKISNSCPVTAQTLLLFYRFLLFSFNRGIKRIMKP